MKSIGGFDRNRKQRKGRFERDSKSREQGRMIRKMRINDRDFFEGEEAG